MIATLTLVYLRRLTGVAGATVALYSLTKTLEHRSLRNSIKGIEGAKAHVISDVSNRPCSFYSNLVLGSNLLLLHLDLLKLH